MPSATLSTILNNICRFYIYYYICNMNELRKTKLIQPYALTMSKHKLNVHEMRVMFRVIEALQGEMGKNIQKDLFGNLMLELKTQDLLPEGSQNYSVVKHALNSLEAKKMEVKGEDSDGEYVTRVGYIRKPRYYLNNSIVKLEIDQELLDVYLELANGYTRYALDVAFNSDSAYTMKLYQFISHWKDKKTITVDYWELRELLNLENKYSKINDFKKRVLNPVVEELKKKGDTYFTYREIKVGRTITGFLFQIFTKVESEKEKAVIDSAKTAIYNYLKRDFGFNDSQLKQVKPFIDKDELQPMLIDKILSIKEAMTKKINSGGKINNKAGYAISSIQNAFAKYL